MCCCLLPRVCRQTCSGGGVCEHGCAHLPHALYGQNGSFWTGVRVLSVGNKRLDEVSLSVRARWFSCPCFFPCCYFLTRGVICNPSNLFSSHCHLFPLQLCF